MVEQSAVLIPHDEEERGAPHVVVRAEDLVDVPDELIPGQHEIVWVLIGRERSILLIMVGRFNERIVWQLAPLAIGDEVAIETKMLRPQKRHPEGPALRTIVVDPALLSRGLQPAVNPLPVPEPDERGIDLAERRPEMRELTVGWGRRGHRCKPAVAHEIVLREGRQGGELFRPEAAHDVGGVASPSLVAQGEAPHGGHVWSMIARTVQLE